MTRRSAPAAEPGDLDPTALLGPLSGRRGLVVAVSGGPDSTALMLLAARWPGRPPLLVATVDHGLRPEAAAEARLVVENAARLGLEARILRAPPREASGNLQDWARRARYAALASVAREKGFDSIVTAHHRDDQAETFLLRLARGSGVYGLAAMAEEGSVEGVALARPLLAVPREALVRLAAKSGLATVADPSNDDPRFDRVRMRALLPILSAHGLDATGLAATAGRLGRAAAALDHYARDLLSGRFAADPFGVVSGPAAAFAEAPEEVALRALALTLKAVGGADYTPRLDSVEALGSAVAAAGAEGRVKRTLHGVVVAVDRGRLTARREWGRAGLAETIVPAAGAIVWDKRFRVDVPPLAGALRIGPLGRSGRRLRAQRAAPGVVAALPGLYQDGTLIAVPARIVAADEGAALAPLAADCLVPGRLGLAPAAGAAP